MEMIPLHMPVTYHDRSGKHVKTRMGVHTIEVPEYSLDEAPVVIEHDIVEYTSVNRTRYLAHDGKLWGACGTPVWPMRKEKLTPLGTAEKPMGLGVVGETAGWLSLRDYPLIPRFVASKGPAGRLDDVELDAEPRWDCEPFREAAQAMEQEARKIILVDGLAWAPSVGPRLMLNKYGPDYKRAVYAQYYCDTPMRGKVWGGGYGFSFVDENIVKEIYDNIVRKRYDVGGLAPKVLDTAGWSIEQCRQDAMDDIFDYALRSAMWYIRKIPIEEFTPAQIGVISQIRGLIQEHDPDAVFSNNSAEVVKNRSLYASPVPALENLDVLSAFMEKRDGIVFSKEDILILEIVENTLHRYREELAPSALEALSF